MHRGNRRRLQVCQTVRTGSDLPLCPDRLNSDWRKQGLDIGWLTCCQRSLVTIRAGLGIAMKLDRIDLKILRQLQTDGRISNVDLADAVGLSPSPCLARIKRLQKAGIIVGYEAQFDLEKLGNFITAYVQVILKNHRRAEAQRFEKAIIRIREVVEFHMVNGKYDYLMKIVAPGYDGPARVMEDIWQADLGIQSYSVFIVSGMPIRNRPLPIGV